MFMIIARYNPLRFTYSTHSKHNKHARDGTYVNRYLVSAVSLVRYSCLYIRIKRGEKQVPGRTRL